MRQRNTKANKEKREVRSRRSSFGGLHPLSEHCAKQTADLIGCEQEGPGPSPRSAKEKGKWRFLFNWTVNWRNNKNTRWMKEKCAR